MYDQFLDKETRDKCGEKSSKRNLSKKINK